MEALDASKNVRIPQSYIDRADAVADALMKKFPMKVTQSDVFRQAMARGLDSLEEELGIVQTDSDKK